MIETLLLKKVANLLFKSILIKKIEIIFRFFFSVKNPFVSFGLETFLQLAIGLLRNSSHQSLTQRIK